MHNEFTRGTSNMLMPRPYSRPFRSPSLTWDLDTSMSVVPRWFQSAAKVGNPCFRWRCLSPKVQKMRNPQLANFEDGEDEAGNCNQTYSVSCNCTKKTPQIPCPNIHLSMVISQNDLFSVTIFCWIKLPMLRPAVDIKTDFTESKQECEEDYCPPPPTFPPAHTCKSRV